MSDSVFTKIIKGELPAHKIFEDDKTLVIVPLHPIAKGHLLVIAKTQVDEFQDLADGDYQALMKTVKMMAQHMKQRLQTKRVGLQIVGLDVPHVHVHVVAFDTIEEYRQAADESSPPDEAKMAELAQKLAL
ncbi:MAG: histidine triad family protein [Patescibacteria group bacterium]|nr:histidine triad family protein [Patescibacteria group bacterium]